MQSEQKKQDSIPPFLFFLVPFKATVVVIITVLPIELHVPCFALLLPLPLLFL